MILPRWDDANKGKRAESRARAIEWAKINHDIDRIGNEILDEILYYTTSLKSGRKRKHYRAIDGTFREARWVGA